MTDTTFEQGTLVVVEEHDGFWTVEGNAKGWITVKQDDETLKVRAKQLELVPDEEDEDEDEGSSMAKTLNRYKVNYLPCTTATGSKSLNNGDVIAQMLEGETPQRVAFLADVVLEEAPGFHEARYQLLNPGQMRMNSGNRIRAFAKRGDEEFQAVLAAGKEHGFHAETEIEKVASDLATDYAEA